MVFYRQLDLSKDVVWEFSAFDYFISVLLVVYKWSLVADFTYISAQFYDGGLLVIILVPWYVYFYMGVSYFSPSRQP